MEGFDKQTIKLRKGATGNTEFWTEEDWVAHKAHVKDLIERGEYLDEYEVTVFVEPLDMFDKEEQPSFESNRFIILDLSDSNQIKTK